MSENGTSPQDRSSQDRVPSVRLTPGNISLLVLAIGGLVTIAVSIQMLKNRVEDSLVLQRQGYELQVRNRETMLHMENQVENIQSRMEWLLRQSPQPRSSQPEGR